MIDFKCLHVGLTNRCRLLCPECTRTTPHNKYIHNMFDMDILNMMHKNALAADFDNNR